MTLTKDELNELAGLIQVIEIDECFGTSDLILQAKLGSKATDEELAEARKLAYKPYSKKRLVEILSGV